MPLNYYNMEKKKDPRGRKPVKDSERKVPVYILVKKKNAAKAKRLIEKVRQEVESAAS